MIPSITGSESDDPLATITPTTLRLYERLPEYVRVADATEGGDIDRPLLRYLSTVADSAGEVEQTLDRIDPAVNGRSDLVNAATADSDWLYWLAGLLSVANPRRYTEAELRALLVSASDRWGSVGTLKSILDTVIDATATTVVATRRWTGPFGIRLNYIGAATYGSIDSMPGTYDELFHGPTYDDFGPDTTNLHPLAVGAVLDAANVRPAGHSLWLASRADPVRRDAAGARPLLHWWGAESAGLESLVVNALDAHDVVVDGEYELTGSGWKARHGRAGAAIHLALNYR